MFSRKVTLFLLVAMFSLASCTSLNPTAVPTPTSTPKPITVSDADFLLGLWRGMYADSEVVMSFDAEGNISIAVYGNLQGGTYTLNLETTPYQMDIVVTDVGTITTIVEFVDENTIKIENVYPFDDRPTEFSDFFLLTRSEE